MTPNHSVWSLRARWLALGVLALSSACDGGSTDEKKTPTGEEVGPGGIAPGDGAEDFVSDVPGQNGARNAGGNGGESADASAAAPVAAGAEDGNKAERAISEADIIKVEGDTLYALSRYAGLSIIDISNPAQLRLLGNHRANATPFEMYLVDGVAYVMFTDYGSFELDEETDEWAWRYTSRMQALDVTDPANIKLIADEAVAGFISDSRLVGNVIYLVTYEDGWCWSCDRSNPNTRVVSFDIQDRTKFTRIDELRFPGDEGSYRRSISVNQERIYVGGPNWQNKDSNIQVVDIADPTGDLKLGADIPIRGSVQSRWQMDEYQGVLRVITQPTAWRSNDPPYVQTFKVDSSMSVTKLASLPVKLPRPENLQSVRFDGTRAYAVTFEQTDPLFTFDLTDPAQPVQVGELEIPGFVYHMEPRGDRIYALGFDNSVDNGSLHVSIFDVSVLSKPTMLDRVNFGGDWASLSEDQDRIQKAFNIALDKNLILVPFGGGSYDEKNCNYSYQSGIQIIDVFGDDLTLRAVAPQIGEARRSLLHRDHLFGISDNAVQVFDIADRSNPVKRTQLEVARNISQVNVMGDKLMRFGSDWWTKRAVLDFTTFDNAGKAEGLGEIDLGKFVAEPKDQCNGNAHWEGQAYVNGDTAYVPRREYSYGQSGNEWTHQESLTFYVVDLRDRTAPKIVGSFKVEGSPKGFLGGVVMTKSALLVGRGEGYYNYDPQTGERTEPTYAYDIYDLSNPRAPTFTKRFEVPSQLAIGGWGYGAIGCGVDMAWGWWFGGSTGALVAGDLVVSQHEESVKDGSGRVRYFLDRIDVSDPSAPKLLPSVNIPGQVVHYDHAQKRVVTLDYVYSEMSADAWEDCYGYGNAWFDDRARVCRIYDRRINALVLGDSTAKRVSMLVLDGERSSGSIAITDERVFYTSHEARSFDSNRPPKVRMDMLAYTSDGKFQVLPSVDLPQVGWWWGQIYGRGERAFVTLDGALGVIDTANKNAPTYTRHDMMGWGCNSLEVAGDKAFCALGEYGVMSVDL